MKLFRALPLASDSHQFFLVAGAGNRPRDGWFEVSWLPNWTDADGDNAKFIRRRLRGRWIRIELAQRPGVRIFRRLSFCGSAAVDVQGGRGGTAVHLSWDDRIALYDESVVRQQSAPVELKLTAPKCWDWAHILTRIPREGSEGAVVGLVALVLAITGLLVAAISIQWSGPRSSAVQIQEEVNSKVSAPGAVLAPLVVTKPSPLATVEQRWSLSNGDRCELVVRSIGEVAGSRGLMVECDTSADQQLVLQVDAKIQAGRWTLRVDDGAQSPIYLTLPNYKACRITGSKYYRFLIYTDDIGSSISIKDIKIRTNADSDDELPLVWPTSGPILDQDQQRHSQRWIELLGLSDVSGTVDRARVITNFIYQRSNVVGLTGSFFCRFGSTDGWEKDPTRTVDGLCGTFVSAALDLSAKLSITARRVSLATRGFAEGTDAGATHEIFEVFDPASRRWILFDPSFNLMFEGPDGQSLGLRDLLKTAADGKSWRAVPIGTLRHGRSIDDYYLKYSDLLWMGNAPAVPVLGEAGAKYQSQAQSVEEVYSAEYPSFGGP